MGGDTLMSRHLLIDGDTLVYRFAHSEQRVIKWDRDLHTTHAFLEPAQIKLANYVEELMEMAKADLCTIILSDLDHNFRKDLDGDYKANRAGVVRPILFKPLREFLFEEYNAVEEPRLEGDDLLGLYATNPADGDEAIIASLDKDLLTVPGLHLRLDTEKVQEVSEEDARQFHLIQTLTGDRVDGYSGIPGVGPVKAKRILKDVEYEDAWEDAIVPAYEKAGLNEEMALLNARYARVLQGNDYDFETKEITLWEPTRKS